MSRSSHYFAYGSNMSRARLQERIPAAEPVGAAFIRDRRLAYNKRGADGTGKANLVEAIGRRAWGVLYRLDLDDWPALDRFEPGYVRSRVEVWTRPVADALEAPTRHQAQIYLAVGTGDELVPAPWYRDHLLVGAREHALPGEIIREIELLGRD